MSKENTMETIEKSEALDISGTGFCIGVDTATYFFLEQFLL